MHPGQLLGQTHRVQVVFFNHGLACLPPQAFALSGVVQQVDDGLDPQRYIKKRHQVAVDLVRMTSATGGVSLATMAAPMAMASSKLQLSTNG